MSSVPVSKASRYSSFFIWFFIFVIFRLLMIACLSFHQKLSSIYTPRKPQRIMGRYSRGGPYGSIFRFVARWLTSMLADWRQSYCFTTFLPGQARAGRDDESRTSIVCVWGAWVICYFHQYDSSWVTSSSTYHVLGVLGHVHLLCNPFLPGQARAGRD